LEVVVPADAAGAKVRPVTPAFAVAGQIRPEDVRALAGEYALLINNRPDGEEPGQSSHAELEAAAAAEGVAYRFIPVRGAPDAEQAAALQSAVAQASGPVLAFCRTGTRSVTAWGLGQALAGRPVEEVAADGARAGYDLGPALQMLLPQLR